AKFHRTASMVRWSWRNVSKAMSAVYRWILSIAVRISAIHLVQGSRGTDRFPKRVVANVIAQSIRRDKVDRPTQELAEEILEPDEPKQAGGPIELDQEVDVAFRAGLIARHRAEEGERAHAEGADLVLMGGEDRQHLVASHGRAPCRA